MQRAPYQMTEERHSLRSTSRLKAEDGCAAPGRRVAMRTVVGFPICPAAPVSGHVRTSADAETFPPCTSIPASLFVLQPPTLRLREQLHAHQTSVCYEVRYLYARLTVRLGAVLTIPEVGPARNTGNRCVGVLRATMYTYQYYV